MKLFCDMVAIDSALEKSNRKLEEINTSINSNYNSYKNVLNDLWADMIGHYFLTKFSDYDNKLTKNCKNLSNQYDEMKKIMDSYVAEDKIIAERINQIINMLGD